MNNSKKVILAVAAVIIIFFAYTQMNKTSPENTAPSGGTTPSVTESADEGSAASGGEDVKYKSEIVVARLEDSNNLDPVMQDGNVNIWIFDLVMEGLLRTTDDGSGIEPMLAESYEVSDDSLTYTFTLRDGLKFSSGDPVIAEDLIWSYERAMTTEESVWRDLLENIGSVEAPDDTTFIIRMKQASPVSEATFTLFNVLIGDKSYFDEIGLENYSKKPLGTGPFMFDEWRQGEYLRIAKNDNYRNTDDIRTQSIKFNVVPDDNTRVMQLQSGEADIITFVPWNRLSEIGTDPALKVLTPQSTEMRNLDINCVEGPTADVKVRRAIAMAINKEAIVKTVLFGYGTTADSFISSAVTYYSKPQVPEYDVEAAKALLAEAGYPDGFEATLTTVSGNAVYEQMATMIKEQLAAVGIDMKIELLEAGTHNNLRNNLKLQMFFGGWTNDIPDPSQQAGYFTVPTMSNCVHTGWVNNRAVELTMSASVEMDSTKRAELYAELQQIYADEVPSVPVYYAPFPVAMKAKISGFAQTPLGNYRFANLLCEE
ncbi:MAG: ABC transporter substrate-binding protein [Synergistaceae bacterium]|nr:ABC transporter substrate-binding protein [Synergistaceae bacterium]